MNKSDSHKSITGYFLLPEISNGLLRVPGSSVRSGTRMILLSDAESETPSTQASGDVDALGLGRADRRLDGRGAGGLGGLSGIGLGLGALGAELGRSTSNLLPAASGSNQAARVGERLVGGHLEILKILSGGERGDGRPEVVLGREVSQVGRLGEAGQVGLDPLVVGRDGLTDAHARAITQVDHDRLVDGRQVLPVATAVDGGDDGPGGADEDDQQDREQEGVGAHPGHGLLGLRRGRRGRGGRGRRGRGGGDGGSGRWHNLSSSMEIPRGAG